MDLLLTRRQNWNCGRIKAKIPHCVWGLINNRNVIWFRQNNDSYQTKPPNFSAFLLDFSTRFSNCVLFKTSKANFCKASENVLIVLPQISLFAVCLLRKRSKTRLVFTLISSRDNKQTWVEFGRYNSRDFSLFCGQGGKKLVNWKKLFVVVFHFPH